MMRHPKLAVLFPLLLALSAVVARPLAAQEMSRDQFLKSWNQGIELEDDKLLDKAMKRGASRAIRYYEELWFQARSSNNIEAELSCDKMMESWQRCFGNKETLEKVQRWADGATNDLYNKLQQIRTNSIKLWGDYQDNVVNTTQKELFEGVYADFIKLAKMAESIGHYTEAAELWTLAGIVGTKMPGKTIEEREDVVFSIEQVIACRDRWGYTFDSHYASNKQFIKDERLQIEVDRKSAKKRAAEGYGKDAKGVEALVMPNVPAAKFELEFAALKDWHKDLDYGPRGGPVPPFWWLDSLGEPGTSHQMGWFRARTMYLLRQGANKFAVNIAPDDGPTAVEIDASPRAKPTTFYLAADKKLPYAMFFWLGTDQEATGVAKCNYSATDKIANIYYRSASSWKVTVGKQKLVFYDDDASGKPGDAEPFIGELKSHLVGDPTGAGVIVPLFDSMQIGKDRVPFSQFVKLDTGWHHMEIPAGDIVTLRPLNPEYVKTGKVKLKWTGSKSVAPDQLVIQGQGDYQTAMFDIAGGKEVEVPAGDYSAIWGRLVNGKGARLQTAQFYPTDESKSFLVEPDKTLVIEMGAPFRLEFTRDGDQNASISALSLQVRERSGMMITGLHGESLACQVYAAKDDSGKGKKEVGEFVPFTNDQLLGKATQQYPNLGFLVACFPMPKGYKEGDLSLSMKLPAAGMKLGLAVKKNKLFGKFETVWK